MNDAHEWHPSPIGVLEIFIEHRFDFRRAIPTEIEFEIHRPTRGRHHNRPRRLLVARPAKTLERADWLSGLERAKCHVGHSTIDGNDLPLLIKRDDSYPVPRSDRLS